MWPLFTISIDSKEALVAFAACLDLISLRLELNCRSWTPVRMVDVGGGGRCQSPVQRQTPINILETERKGGAVQDSPEFLSSLVSAAQTLAAAAAGAIAAASLWILGSLWSGSLKITLAINKQTEAITGSQREEKDWIRSGWAPISLKSKLMSCSTPKTEIVIPSHWTPILLTPTACSDTAR